MYEQKAFYHCAKRKSFSWRVTSLCNKENQDGKLESISVWSLKPSRKHNITTKRARACSLSTHLFSDLHSKLKRISAFQVNFAVIIFRGCSTQPYTKKPLNIKDGKLLSGRKTNSSHRTTSLQPCLKTVYE